MTSIYNYIDFRCFLKDKFDECKKKNPNFSYRVFNRMAGIKSSAFLKLVTDGKRNLADNGIQGIIKGFKLTEAEARYFEILVRFNQAISHADKDRYFKQLSQNRKFLKAKPLSTAEYHLFSRWYYAAILEMVRLDSPHKKDVNWLKRKLNPPVGLREIKQAVKELKFLTLLKEDEKGGFSRKDDMLASADEVKGLYMINFHAEMSEMAKRAVTREQSVDQEFSTLTIATSEKGLKRAKQEIQLFRKRLHSILEDETGGPRNTLGQINLQLFKMSKK